MELKRVSPNKEQAKSILKMACMVEKRIGLQDRKRMHALILADYYEIIKELLTALLLLDGYKSLSHKDLLQYFTTKSSALTSDETSHLDDLRILRNRILYEGFSTRESYLGRHEREYKSIIRKLKGLLRNKLILPPS